MEEDRNDSALDETWKAEAEGAGFYRNGAREASRAAEEAAADDTGRAETKKAESDVSEARENERKGFYQKTSKVEGAKPFRFSDRRWEKDVVKGGIRRGWRSGRGLKKYGPAGLILTVVIVMVGLFAGSQAMAPFAFVANALDEFNTLRTAMNRRSNVFMKFQMDAGTNVSVTKKKAGWEGWIFGEEKFSIGKKTRAKMKNNNIEYVETEVGGKKTKFLVYDDPEKGKIPVVANDTDLDRLKAAGVFDADGVEVDGGRVLKLDDALASPEIKFREDFDVSTRTLKGHIAGWFTNVSNAFHKRISNIRNRFRSVGKEASDEEIEAAAKASGMEEGVPATKKSSEMEEDDGSVEYEYPEEAYDEDGELRKVNNQVVDENGNPVEPLKDGNGNPKRKSGTTTDITDDDSLKKGMTSEAAETALKSRALKAAGTVTSAGQAMCGIAKAAGAINVAISAINIAQSMNFTTSFLEAVNKTQVEGNSSAMTYFMTSMQTPGDTYAVGQSEEAGDKPLKENSTAWGSAGVGQVFGREPVEAGDQVAQKFNNEYALKNGLKSLANNPPSGNWGSVAGWLASAANVLGVGDLAAWANTDYGFKTCLAIDTAGNVLDFVTDVLAIVAALPTLGTSVALKEAGKAVIGFAFSAGMMASVSLIVSAVIPAVTQILNMDLIGDMIGEDAGYALLSGVNLYMGRRMKSTSGRTGNEAQVLAQYKETQEVIAEEAELERRTLSPFDITSKNTFLGSIVYAMIPITNQFSNSFTSTVSSGLGVVKNSAIALLPTAAAEGEATFKATINHDCPSLNAVGVVGDAFCNPYYVFDSTTTVADVDGGGRNTMGMHPGDVVDAIGVDNFEDNLDSSGNVVVKDDSDLAKWIKVCEISDEPVGYNSGVNLSLISSGDTTIDAIAEAGLSSVPALGSLYGLVQDAAEVPEIEWGSQKKCVTHEKASLYGQFAIDQEIMEEEGMIEQSAIGAFVEKYYEENPIDYSLEGTIARYSGLSYEDVDFVLGLIEYADFIANYQPEGRGPEEPVVHDERVFFESSAVVAEVLPGAVVVENIVYFDLRNRAKLV